MHIEVQSHFYLPDRSDERVPGILTFNTESAGTLTLIGELPRLNSDGLRILGETMNNIYTLEDCFETYSDRINLRQVLHVQRLLVGIGYEKEELIVADRLSVHLANLTHWLRSSEYGDALKFRELPNGEGWTISCEQVARSSVTIPAGTLRLGQSRGLTGDGITSRSLTQTASFDVEFKGERSVEDVIEFASDLQDMVSMATDRPAVFEKVLLWHADIHQEVGDGRRVPVPVEYLANWIAQPDANSRPPSDHDMVFTFEELGGIEGAARWLDVAEKYRTMLGAVMATRYASKMFVQDRFLERMAALEGFHAAKSGMTSLGLLNRLQDLTETAGDPARRWCHRRRCPVPAADR